MSLHRLSQASWLRTALRVLVLCFALGTLAHAGHTHELNSGVETHYKCDYCTSFGSLIDTSVTPTVIAYQATSIDISAAPSCSVVAHVVGLPQARAPPAR